MYDFRPTETSPERIAQYAALLAEVFPTAHKFSSAFLTWQYAANPAGTVVGFDAWAADGSLAAHYVTIPVRYNWQGRQVKALLSLNTATHPAHQGKGLFTQLANRTYEAAAAQGYAFVIGVANQNSTPGFLKKLAFTLVAPLDVRIGRGGVSYPVNGGVLQSAYAPELARWRVANPSASYYSQGGRLCSKTDQGMIQAVLSVRQEFGGVAQPASRRLLDMWIGLCPAAKFGGIFYSLPDRLKPSPLNLIFRSLQADIAVPRAEDVCFEAIDFDAY